MLKHSLQGFILVLLLHLFPTSVIDYQFHIFVMLWLWSLLFCTSSCVSYSVWICLVFFKYYKVINIFLTLHLYNKYSLVIFKRTNTMRSSYPTHAIGTVNGLKLYNSFLVIWSTQSALNSPIHTHKHLHANRQIIYTLWVEPH